jgi:hypothetical protein
MTGDDYRDDEDDPWLRQFLAGQRAKEQRANETGWGCAIFFILIIVMIALSIAGNHR